MTDPLLEALQSRSETHPDTPGRTSRELAEALGKSANTIVKRLHALQKEGRLIIHHVKRPTLDGRIMPSVTYELKDNG